nr:hypothetical protein [Kitasatospora sp. Root107]
MIKPAPRWAVVAAHAVPLVTLPSGLWRIGLLTGFPDWYGEHNWALWEQSYVVMLTVVAEALALLTLGLVRPWGEVVPDWVPLLGGRRVPVLAAVVPAATGAFLVTTYATVNQLLHLVEPLNDTGEGMPNSGPGFWLLLVCYLPLVAWGPLLAAVTVAYYRRRRGSVGRLGGGLGGGLAQPGQLGLELGDPSGQPLDVLDRVQVVRLVALGDLAEGVDPVGEGVALGGQRLDGGVEDRFGDPVRPGVDVLGAGGAAEVGVLQTLEHRGPDGLGDPLGRGGLLGHGWSSRSSC